MSNRKRANSHISGHRGASINFETLETTGNRKLTFRFKDNEDFNSMYTPWERLERQKNYDLFKEKYGDPTIAFRSIGSQSEYKPVHDYRERDKSREIHPPMKYTNKPTKQVLANIKNRKTLLMSNN